MLRQSHLLLQKKYYSIYPKWERKRSASRTQQQKQTNNSNIRSASRINPLFTPKINPIHQPLASYKIKKARQINHTYGIKRNSKNALFEAEKAAQTFFLSQVKDVNLKYQSFMMMILNINRAKRNGLKKKLKKSMRRAAFIKYLLKLKHVHRRQMENTTVRKDNKKTNYKNTCSNMLFFEECPVLETIYSVVNSAASNTQDINQSHRSSNQQRLY